jgi:hypothetical protein
MLYRRSHHQHVCIPKTPSSNFSDLMKDEQNASFPDRGVG